ncbi:hypothetical protein BJAS_P4359 [Bathymodiolus japonicus methanotrophic gill symbiont]|nr:hypothetical protein BJAS_P4359 [Bathymodiolus japonicus methanotrophic gill symbiont]
MAASGSYFVHIPKYLNNIIEQDHRFIKKITKPMMGFKAFHSAQATIDGLKRTYDPNRGVAIFAKACFGHPSPSKRKNLTRPLMPPAAPIRPRHLVPTQQGVGT